MVGFMHKHSELGYRTSGSQQSLCMYLQSMLTLGTSHITLNQHWNYGTAKCHSTENVSIRVTIMSTAFKHFSAHNNLCGYHTASGSNISTQEIIFTRFTHSSACLSSNATFNTGQ